MWSEAGCSSAPLWEILGEWGLTVWWQPFVSTLFSPLLSSHFPLISTAVQRKGVEIKVIPLWYNHAILLHCLAEQFEEQPTCISNPKCLWNFFWSMSVSFLKRILVDTFFSPYFLLLRQTRKHNLDHTDGWNEHTLYVITWRQSHFILGICCRNRLGLVGLIAWCLI